MRARTVTRLATAVALCCLLGACEQLLGGGRARDLSWQAEVDAVALVLHADAAARGSMEGFDALDSGRDAIEAALATPEGRALPAAVGPAWVAARTGADVVLSHRDALLVATDAESEFVARVPPMAARIDEAGRALAEAGGGASATQNVYLLGRLQVLLERMQRRLAQLRGGGSDSISAADAFARDATMMERTLAGLLDGSAELAIEALPAGAARSALEDVRGEFDVARKGADPILATLTERLEVREAADELPSLVADLQAQLQRARQRR